MAMQMKFEMPKRIVVEEATRTATYAKLIGEPFEAGFGHTLGNALRLVLLSSLEGAAITTVKIDGVAHEFSTIEGVHEDVTHIVLNLKKVLFKVTTRKPFECQLKVKGPGEITAGMITVPAGVTVLNPEHVICTVAGKQSFKMEMSVEVGRGYRPAELNKPEPQIIGVIPMDSLFSPVARVKYAVEAARVGQKTDYDRLVLEVWTDGRVDPVAAVVQSAQLLLDHVELYRHVGEAMFLGGEGEVGAATEEKKAEEEEGEDTESIETLNISRRTANVLIREGIKRIPQLVEKTERELLALKNFGEKAVQEVIEALHERKLELRRESASDEEIADLMKKSTQKKK
ncbi:MAG: DNA-directed RNA polymerase subunit alpha [bacterium]|nr:DNA-directed RNA polymerase subunit alpha [bacterium]